MTRAGLELERRKVPRSHRVVVTEKLIRETGASAVLEIGAGDHSFRHVLLGPGRWTCIDFGVPCDVLCDANDDAVHLPFRDGSFDLIVCTEVVEHMLWPQHLVRESFRLLRPGGGLLISVPNIASATYRVAWLLGRLPSCAASGNLPSEMGSTAYRTGGGRYVGGHVVDFTRKRLEQLLRSAGFVIRRTCGSGIIWHRQLLPAWAVPVALSSNIICLGIRTEGAPDARRAGVSS